ncbi:MAG TPA: hypothetical protein VH302_04080 [Bryobacteraceae bacterium]|nr:hypothetical protein [Bryobacteraceae bacterium]
MRLLWTYLERYGRPVDFYTDKASLFTINRRLHYNKHLPEQPGKTQIGRALEELGIGWIAAHSPQANAYASHCTSFKRSGMTDVAGRRRPSVRSRSKRERSEYRF